jgi:hypothetical protein
VIKTIPAPVFEVIRMGFAKKAGGYAMVFSFILYGGCDHVMRKYLKPEYSERAIRMRETAAGIVDAIASNTFDSAEQSMSELENNLKEVEKNDRAGE